MSHHLQIVKFTADVAADTNIPAAVRPYDASWFNVVDGIKQVNVVKDGTVLTTGADNSFDVYPGTDPAAGDIKTKAGVTNGDVWVVQWGKVEYAEVDGT